MRVLAGTSGFSYGEWKGSFYPEDLPAARMLSFYAGRLPAVEINNTFYRMPTVKVLEAWANEVPEGFRFVLKASRRITHIQRMKESAEAVSYFFRTASSLGQRLGPVLFQLPPNLKKDLPRLTGFLSLLPSEVKSAFEFRHPSWFEEDVFDALRSHGASLCVAEDEKLKTPFVATADWGYLRLRRQDYGPDDLKAISQEVLRQAWTEAYVFFKHEDGGTGPALATELLTIAQT